MTAISPKDLGSTIISDEPHVGRAAVMGAVIGFLLAAPLFTVVGLVFGAGLTGALAIGVFVGVWGGCGWGGMLAASLALTRQDLLEASRPRH